MVAEIVVAKAGLDLAKTAIREKIKEQKSKDAEFAREILLSAIRLGKDDLDALVERDSFLRSLRRYERAVREGAKHRSLRLMAAIVRKQIEAGDIESDKFGYLEDVAAELSDIEIRFLFEFLNLSPEVDNGSGQVVNNRYLAAQRALVGEGKLFTSNGDMDALCARLSRTGLISYTSWFGGGGYLETPLLVQLIELVELQTFNNVAGQ